MPKLASILVLALLGTEAASPQATTGKQSPASLSPDPFIVMDSVVTEQWPATLANVNAPVDMQLLNPGQCIRVAALAVGSGHEHFFDDTSISFNVRLGTTDIASPLAPSAATKMIKPDGGDFVSAALAAGGVKDNPFLTTGAMTVSQSKWCVPDDASDGSIVIRAVVKRGKSESDLNPKTVTLESLDSASKKAFKDEKEFSTWIQTYHASPEPGRLLPALIFFTSLGENAKSAPIMLEFFKDAFKHDAATAQAFGPWLAQTDKLTRMTALVLLSKAGVQLRQPPPLSDDDRKFVATAPDLPNPFDMKQDQQLFTKLDCLWADFSATGRIEPVSAVASALAWEPDYEAFVQMKKSGKKPDGLTDSLVRGVTYMAAGWSLNSFNRNDPLATDYIQAIVANPATPVAIKKGLANLDSNPAFKEQ
jgi:hypothetical protein